MDRRKGTFDVWVRLIGMAEVSAFPVRGGRAHEVEVGGNRLRLQAHGYVGFVVALCEPVALIVSSPGYSRDLSS